MRLTREERASCQASLEQVFGVSGFRPGQEKAVTALLHGRDVMGIMPTGSGKSLCYQLPAVLKPGLTLVVSPLIALMRDQAAHLAERGVSAAWLDSLQDCSERDMMEGLVRKGAARLLFVSPERLAMPRFAALMAEHPPWMIVVDEAHCVVRWGEEFRPAYAAIGAFAAKLKQRPILCAVTATADGRLRRAIEASLGLQRPSRVRLPLRRENLHYAVKPTIHPMADMLAMVKVHAEKGQSIVFCPTRFMAEQAALRLKGQGIAAAYYHAGMTRPARAETQASFMRGDCRVMAATSAFGMGIDQGDVRLVLLMGLPSSQTDLAQQFGRAGRDGRDADCVLLFDPADLLRLRRHMAVARREIRSVKKYLHYARGVVELRQLLDWCLSGRCLAVGLSGGHGKPCGVCSACRHHEKHHRRYRLAPTPRLEHMTEDELSVWALDWIRKGISESRGVPKQQVLSDQQLAQAGLRRALSENAASAEDLRRFQAVLMHMLTCRRLEESSENSLLRASTQGTERD